MQAVRALRRILAGWNSHNQVGLFTWLCDSRLHQKGWVGSGPQPDTTPAPQTHTDWSCAATAWAADLVCFPNEQSQNSLNGFSWANCWNGKLEKWKILFAEDIYIAVETPRVVSSWERALTCNLTPKCGVRSLACANYVHTCLFNLSWLLHNCGALLGRVYLQVTRTTASVCARMLLGSKRCPDLPCPELLTVVGHAHWQALLETAVLALVAVLLLDLAAALALVVLELQADGPPKKTLGGREKGKCEQSSLEAKM